MKNRDFRPSIACFWKINCCLNLAIQNIIIIVYYAEAAVQYS